MLVIFVSLLTGMRIAALNYDSLRWFSSILPQGNVHDWHLISGLSLLLITVSYLLGLFTKSNSANKKGKKNLRSFYHKTVQWLGYTLIVSVIVSGLSIYWGVAPNIAVLKLHYYLALFFIAYIVLHVVVYFVQYGINVFEYIFLPDNYRLILQSGIILAIVVLGFLGYPFLISENYSKLIVNEVSIDNLMDVDGYDREAVWQKATPITIKTHGGANFKNGETSVTLKAIHNREEIFFYLTWEDPTQSIKHLPLLKTEKGWQVQENGFHRFDEVEFYEDKFAIMLSDECRLAASGTAHLGHQPMADKPANWHGKGYHYTEGDRIVDVWHWKAVRTNDMFLADDNFFGPADRIRNGSRRYTAGYMPDGKESGTYVMNWKWYNAKGVIPKRLPKNNSSDLLQQSINPLPSENWVIPWFDFEPYSAEKDTYPVGTLMPSVMYRSNRFEGDRADVRARAYWKDGYWRMELSRKLNTGSRHDIEIKNNVCLWVSAFDHAQVAHTRHIRPVQLKVM